MLVSGRQYTLIGLVNGKAGDSIVISEMGVEQFQVTQPTIMDSITARNGIGYPFNDTVYYKSADAVIAISGKQSADGIFPTCENTVVKLWLPLIGYLTFFCGLMHLLSDSGAIDKMARFLSPLFSKIFPELPPGHPAYGLMTLNFAANFLGLDNAATPFGLKAMESMQESNPIKDRATNSQIMFLCLHAAGLTLIPTSIIGYRAAQHAANPADVMIPTLITSFVGTIAALFFVGIRQRINLIKPAVIGFVAVISAVIGFLLFYINQLAKIEKLHFTGNLSNGVLLFIILIIVAFCIRHEKYFRNNGTNIFDSFITGAKEGFTTGVRILPYLIAMLVALSIFRNSGLMTIIMTGISSILALFHVDQQVINAIPVALMRPFSPSGSRGFMFDSMRIYGADSLTGRLSCLFQGAAETTFYVIALYFGSVNVKDTRYTLGIMLLVDLVCVLTAIAISVFYF